ncbi:MAG: zinc ribbon domain-containing protein [Nanoarchaeota archaeon]|nr:zinc ribbon domain-containing protein [Nanoarchaeota archaeon]
MRTCKKCGAEAEKGDRYCPECGEKLVEEVRTITVWSIIKVIIIIVFFIIILNVLKQKQVALPVMFFFFLIFFILWSNVLNWFLKKMFNAEVSRGVKMIVTAVLILVFLGAYFQSSPTKAIIAQPQYMEDPYLFEFVLKLSNILESRDYGSLKRMLEEGAITQDVFDDISKLINDVLYAGDFKMYLKPQNQQTDDNKAKIDTLVFIKSGSVEKTSTTVCLFERGERGWRLFAITPKLVDIKLSVPFEREVEYKLEQVPKPVEAIAEVSQKNTYNKGYSKG